MNPLENHAQSDKSWPWPFKIAATIPIVWQAVAGARSPKGGVLSQVAALGAPAAVVLGIARLIAVAFLFRALL
jgi:hypothetical protein